MGTRLRSFSFLMYRLPQAWLGSTLTWCLKNPVWGSFSLRSQFSPESKPPAFKSNPVVQSNSTICFCLNTLHPEQGRIPAGLLLEYPKARSPQCPEAEVPGGSGNLCVCVGHRGGGWVQAIISSFLSAWASLSRDFAAAAAAKSLQSGPTLCDPIDGSPPGSAVPGILQARTLEWVAISFSNA